VVEITQTSKKVYKAHFCTLAGAAEFSYPT